jgi:hypothetical protein
MLISGTRPHFEKHWTSSWSKMILMRLLFPASAWQFCCLCSDLCFRDLPERPSPSCTDTHLSLALSLFYWKNSKLTNYFKETVSFGNSFLAGLNGNIWECLMTPEWHHSQKAEKKLRQLAYLTESSWSFLCRCCSRRMTTGTLLFHSWGIYLKESKSVYNRDTCCSSLPKHYSQ